MVKQGIQIFARAKPTKQKLAGIYEVYEDDNGTSCLAFTVPKDLADGYINNKREVYKFRFDKVFDQDSKQDEIFEEVAQGVIDNVLTGYNGTIFAYGQGYHGCSIGKAKQAAKTEIEKLNMKDMTCEELVKEVAKIIYVVHDEVKDKNFELELSWIGHVTNGKHEWVPKNIAEAAEKYAKESLEEDSSSEDDD
ncbi:kinesin-like protein KIF6 isoform X1 [Acropora muricata]|uniref:kinesin-like protein KIF6 isoform X1 n=1 Tax=Acropora muricata TaxID=159855 RepID=UPI0034E46BD6